MKNLICKYVVFCMLTILIVGCTPKEKEIHIGYEAWVGYDPITIAKEKQFFEKEGLHVQLHYFYSYNDLVRAFSEEKIDVALLTTNEALMLADKGEKFKMVLMLDYSDGADAVVAKQSIKSVGDLKGKKISLETKSIAQYLLLRALESVKLNESDVSLYNARGDESIALFKSNSVDAASTWAPYVSRLEKDNGHVIFSSHDIPGEIIDLMMIRQNFIDKYPDKCLKLVSAYLKTLDWVHDHMEEAAVIIGKNHQETTSEQFLEDVKGVRLTRLKENLSAFGTKQSPGTLYTSTEKFMSFMLEQKIITNRLSIDQLIDPTFIWEYSKKYDTTHSN